MLIPAAFFHSQKTAAHDASRFQLCGVYLERDATGKCSVTSTDGKRLSHLSWQDWDVSEASGKVEPFARIIPNVDASALAKGKEDVRIAETPNGKAVFRQGSTTVESTPVDGNYPDYRLATEKLCGEGPMVSMRFDLELLADTLSAMKAMIPGARKGDPRYVMMTIYSAEKPIEFKFEGRVSGIETTAQVLAMPLVGGR